MYSYSIYFFNTLDDDQVLEHEIEGFVNFVKEEEYQHNDEQPIDVESEPEVKKFIEEFTDDDSSKIARTLETESPAESHLYHCSECNINFPSIQDHINNCHKDQEVVFQVC